MPVAAEVVGFPANPQLRGNRLRPQCPHPVGFWHWAVKAARLQRHRVARCRRYYAELPRRGTDIGQRRRSCWYVVRRLRSWGASLLYVAVHGESSSGLRTGPAPSGIQPVPARLHERSSSAPTSGVSAGWSCRRLASRPLRAASRTRRHAACRQCLHGWPWPTVPRRR